MSKTPEIRFSQPLLQSGLALDAIITENEARRRNESTRNKFKNICKCQNAREITKYMKHNHIINSFNTRELNEYFQLMHTDSLNAMTY